MRRFAFVLVAIGLVGWSVTTVIGGCGADEASADNPDAAPEGGPFSPGTSGTPGQAGSTGGNPSSSGTSGTGTPGPEAGPPGPTPNPGKITCGATECDAGNNAVCCVRDGGSDTECRRFFCGQDPAVEITCDETTDCPKRGGGQRQELCCFAQSATVCIDDTECPAPGPAPGPRVCKTDVECGDAGPCNPKSCGTSGILVYVCGSPTGCK